MKRSTLLLPLMLLMFISGCATVAGDSKLDKQKAIQNMESEVLAELYKLQPASEKEVSKAKAYAVFNNTNVNIIIAAVGNGYGVLRQKGKSPVYMKMGEAGIGLGMGAKDFRVVFVFNNQETLDKFVDSGWDFAGNADAAAKSGEKGAAVGAEGFFTNGVKVYQITKNGLALQATLKGTRYYKDESLN